MRFALSWVLAIVLVGVVAPRALAVSWHGVIPELRSVHWPALVALVVVWLLGLYAHSFVLTAAAPDLTHRRALTLNVTGSAVSNVVPLGGAAGVELNRRMMKAWGIDARAFTGYTLLTNLWDVGAKLLLPVVGVLALSHVGEVTPGLRTVSLLAGAAFILLAGFAAVLLLSARGTRLLGRALETTLHAAFRLLRRDHPVHLVTALDDVRRECADLVARGWWRMTVGMGGYVFLQYLLLAFCLMLTRAGSSWPEILAAFAVERLLTVVPITPGGIGVADLGLVGVLLTLGGDPVGVTAAAVLYRLFVFAVEIPVGGGVLGVWFLAQLRAPVLPSAPRRPGEPRRIAHVTDVFLPRLGGIETHVDDLVRHQRATGLEAEVLTATKVTGVGATAGEPDPSWVRRLPAARARAALADYDTVHVHLSMWSPYGLGVARAAMAAGIPTLVTVHSMWAGAGGMLRVVALATLRRWPVVWSAVSGAAAATFGRSLALDVAVLPNAVDVDLWRPEPSVVGTDVTDGPSSAGPTGPTGPVVLISVMRLMPRKRPLALLRMYADLRRLVPDQELRLVVVGDGPLRRRAERRIRRLGLTDEVRITGRIPRRQVLDELRAASVYVAPAPKESFGIAALEARCAGLPVVAHRSSGVGEFVRDRVDGMLVAHDREMVVALAELLSNPALHAEIAGHNRRVAPRHDWSDILEVTAGLYREAADRAEAAYPGSSAQPTEAETPYAAGA